MTLSRQLSWSHFIEIIPLKSDIEREFYAQLCRIENWSVRTQREKIRSMLFERTAISQKQKDLAKLELRALKAEDKLSPDLVFKDPYLLDFLGLKDTFLEKDLERAILEKIEHFLLELGRGFTFLERVKVGRYITEELPKDLLRRKLHQFFIASKRQIEHRNQ